MSRREMVLLRTTLRALNIEYSALVRRKAGGDAFARMEQLRVERRAVMSLIAEQQRHESARSAGALSLARLEIEAAPAADTTAAADAASVEVLPAPSGDVLPLVAG